MGGLPAVMNRRGLFRLVLLIGPLLAAGRVTGADELTLREMTAARKIYVSKCAKCHRFYEPTNYAEADWQKWMEKMNKKSKLGVDQAALLARYLDLYRGGQLEGKPQAAPKTGRGPQAARD